MGSNPLVTAGKMTGLQTIANLPEAIIFQSCLLQTNKLVHYSLPVLNFYPLLSSIRASELHYLFAAAELCIPFTTTKPKSRNNDVRSPHSSGGAR